MLLFTYLFRRKESQLRRDYNHQIKIELFNLVDERQTPACHTIF